MKYTGGKKPPTEKQLSYWQYLQSPEWKAKRAACLSRDDHKCRKCGKRGGELHAHHIRYKANRDQETLADLITLCALCHHNEHFGKKPKAKKKKQRKPKWIPAEKVNKTLARIKSA